MIKREELTNPASCMSRAREDEMTFVLLGRDPAAAVAIRAWIAERIRIGKNRAYDAQIIEALKVAQSIQQESPDLAREASALDGIVLGAEVGILARRHRLAGAVLISIKGDNFGMNSSGADDRIGAAMDTLGSRILKALADGFFNPEAPSIFDQEISKS